jgi:hypothetical protein
VRWQEATFEDWTTFTFRVNRPVSLDLSNGGGDPQRDINRTFEVAGVGGGQRVFHYYADAKDHVLYLQDKFKANPERRNRASGAGGDGGTARNLGADSSVTATAKLTAEWIPKTITQEEVNKIDKRASSTRRDREFATAKNNDKRNRMILKYDTKDGNRIILQGINENKDSIYVVLDRVQRKYALSESSLKAGKY